MRRWRVHRRFDDAGRHGVHPNAVFGVFDGERACNSIQASLGECGEAPTSDSDWLLDHGSGDLHDVTAFLCLHVRDRQLGDMEEAIQIDVDDISIVIFRECRERLADKDTGIVHQCIDPSKMLDGGFNYSFGDGALTNVTRHGNHTGIA